MPTPFDLQEKLDCGFLFPALQVISYHFGSPHLGQSTVAASSWNLQKDGKKAHGIDDITR